MAEKLWSECSKEEKKAIRLINKEFKRVKKLYEDGKLKRWQYYLAIKRLLHDLNFFEWYFSDEYQEFLEYKKNIAEYEKVREKLWT